MSCDLAFRENLVSLEKKICLIKKLKYRHSAPLGPMKL